MINIEPAGSLAGIVQADVLDESAIASVALVSYNDSIERCLFRTVPGKANVNGHFSSSTSG
jgi:hypothetical protein